MTSSEIDRVLRALTEIRVDAADRFARLETKIEAHNSVPGAVRDLERRAGEMESRMDGVGKFGMKDLYPFVGAVASAAVIAGILYR